MRKNSRNANGNGSIRKVCRIHGDKTYTYWEARYCAGYNTANGKPIRKSISGNTQKEVAEKLRAATKDLDTGEYIAPTKMTVRQWFNTWLDTFCINKVRESTMYAYRAIVKKHIVPRIGALVLQAVKGVDIQRVYNAMIDEGLSGKTVKNVSAVMHKAFAMARKQGYITSNPCEGAELPKIKKTEIHPFTDDEIPIFLKAVNDDPMANAYALCLFAGLREGECLGLPWSNVDFKKGKITVSQQLQRHVSRSACNWWASGKSSRYANRGCTRQAKEPQYLAENLLNRQFYAEMPNEKWLTDVTGFKWYEGTEAHKVCLSASLDLCDRRIVAYSLLYSTR